MEDNYYAPPKAEVTDLPNLRSPAPVLTLFGYSIALPLIWMSLGLLTSVVLPGKRFGIGGLFFVVLSAVTLASWLFVRKRHRQFAGRELWILVVCCSMWAGLCELSGLVYAAETHMIDPSKSGAIKFAVLFSLTVDTLCIWLGFRFSGRRFINWYITSIPHNAPNLHWSRHRVAPLRS